jgi:hypothetical protein
LDVSEQQPDRISDNLGDVVGAGPTASSPSDAAPSEPMPGPVKESMNVESPKLAPEPGVSDTAKDAPKVDAPKPEATADAPKPEATADAAKPSSQILIMPRDQAWSGDASDPKAQSTASESGIFGKRRMAALAAVVALAVVAGAVGGALATAGVGRISNADTKVAGTRALEDSISRIDTELAALRTSLEQASKHGAAQIGKTVEKLRTVSLAAPAPAPAVAAAAAPVAPKESTGSIQTANAGPAQVPLPTPKPEVARLPTVEGWVLRDVANGSALIEGRQGIFEVYAGDPIPGVGRVDAIRKQDGRWVVVTSRGLIVGR